MVIQYYKQRFYALVTDNTSDFGQKTRLLQNFNVKPLSL